MRPIATIIVGFASLAASLATTGCVVPECVTLDYGRAECRVLAENEHARLQTSTGVEARFLAAGSRDADTWDATGLLLARSDGSIDARVAGLGAFTLALSRGEDGPDAITVHLANVDSGASVTVGPAGEPVGTASPESGQTTRTLDVSLTSDQPVFVDATLDCPPRYRIAVVSDIQTNPDQFRRITEVMREEWRTSTDAGEPLVGLVIPGDVTEASRDEEFQIVAEILSGLPFAVAVTPGNHDIFRPNRPHFTRNFGPGNHAFTVCRTHVALVDSGSGHIARSVEARLPELFDAGGADFSLVGLHHPPYAGWTGAGWSLEDQAAHLLAEAALADVDVVLAGHSHQLADFPDVPVAGVDVREIISGTGGASQGIGEPQYGYVRLTFDGGEVDACFVEVPPPGYAEPPGSEPRIGWCD